jgi:hypothetical protein
MVLFDNLDKTLIVYNLLGISESDGLRQLDLLVPRSIEEGWFDDLTADLRGIGLGTLDTLERRVKARSFYQYARELGRELSK